MEPGTSAGAQPRSVSLRMPLVLGMATLAVSGCFDDDRSESLVGPELSLAGTNRVPPAAFGVYTQNMFLGGDTGPLFEIDLGDLSQVIPATQQFYQQVLASDVPSRVEEFVDEIEVRSPHVVGLQEAVGYATGVLDPATFQFTPTAPGPDLLGAILAEIAARGLPYRLVAMRPTTGIALPMGPPGPQGLPALAVQDRVAMLAHEDVEPVEFASGLYAARIPLGPLDFVRGWARVTVERDGEPWHFVVTHLETQGPGPGHPIRLVHEAQGAELQNVVLAGLEGNVVLMGDLNSDAAADPSARSWTPTYGNLVDGGYLDVWELAAGTRGDGLTCCQEPGRVHDQRIDFVLFRSASELPEASDAGLARGLYRADVVGEDAADRTPGGLWPSDHAGVVADIGAPGAIR